jgi:hypothetical protein
MRQTGGLIKNSNRNQIIVMTGFKSVTRLDPKTV